MLRDKVRNKICNIEEGLKKSYLSGCLLMREGFLLPWSLSCVSIIVGAKIGLAGMLIQEILGVRG